MVCYNDFKLKDDGQLHFKGRDKPLTNKDGSVRDVDSLRTILGVKRLKKLGFDPCAPLKLIHEDPVKLNKAE